jgi:hypothetical protein
MAQIQSQKSHYIQTTYGVSNFSKGEGANDNQFYAIGLHERWGCETRSTT